VRNGKHRAYRYYSNIFVSSSESHISVCCCTQSHGHFHVQHHSNLSRIRTKWPDMYELWGVQCLERDRDITVTLFPTESHFVCPYKLHDNNCSNATARYTAPPSTQKLINLETIHITTVTATLKCTEERVFFFQEVHPVVSVHVDRCTAPSTASSPTNEI